VSTTGGEATGPNGTVSYSVGQVVYTSATGANGTVSAGVQQAFEVSIVTSAGTFAEQLELTVFPNPTAKTLTLSRTDVTSGELTYQLIDNSGTLLNEGSVTTETSLDMESFPKASYFLKVLNGAQVEKTFQIIKN
jgi:hypothetical protein